MVNQSSLGGVPTPKTCSIIHLVAHTSIILLELTLDITHALHSLDTTTLSFWQCMLHVVTALFTYMGAVTQTHSVGYLCIQIQEKALKCKPSVNCACAILLILMAGRVYSWSPVGSSRRV